MSCPSGVGPGVVGIVVNPWAGKDVRRLSAAAGHTPDTAKIGIVRRAIIAALDAGASQVLVSCVELVPSAGTGSRLDTRRAATEFAARRCGVVIVLGGDGTCRDVALGWPEVAMIAVSTGTNNVFPTALDGSSAGTAAALVATGVVERSAVVTRAKRVLVSIAHGDDEPVVDEALVEVALIDAEFTGARAVVDPESVKCVVAAISSPLSTGISSIAGRTMPIGADEPGGVYVRLGGDLRHVRVPLVPGSFDTLHLAELRRLGPDDFVEFDGPGVLAFDGERDRVLATGTTASISVASDGPFVVDVARTLQLAAERQLFDVSRPLTPADRAGSSPLSTGSTTSDPLTLADRAGSSPLSTGSTTSDPLTLADRAGSSPLSTGSTTSDPHDEKDNDGY
jgi:hypothetical protein